MAVMLFSTSLQAQNPFESLGVPDDEVKFLTLSQGRYAEFHKDKEYEIIGSVIIDMKNKKIAGFVDRDTLYKNVNYELETATRFFTMDRFSEKYVELTPYQYAGNNPILNIDVNGDSISISNLYAQKDGEYLYKQQIKSFEVWASTDAGKKYILDHAEKGFSLKGVYEKDLNIEAKEDGSSHTKGIDISFGTHKKSSAGLTGGEISENDGRYKMSITLNDYQKPNGMSKENLFSNVETWCHEAFVHGDWREKNYLGTTNFTSTQNHEHTIPFDKTYYYKVGVPTLQQAQKRLGYQKINSLNYLYYNVMLPNYNYGAFFRNPNIKE